MLNLHACFIYLNAWGCSKNSLWEGAWVEKLKQPGLARAATVILRRPSPSATEETLSAGVSQRASERASERTSEGPMATRSNCLKVSDSLKTFRLPPLRASKRPCCDLKFFSRTSGPPSPCRGPPSPCRGWAVRLPWRQRSRCPWLL